MATEAGTEDVHESWSSSSEEEEVDETSIATDVSRAVEELQSIPDEDGDAATAATPQLSEETQVPGPPSLDETASSSEMSSSGPSQPRSRLPSGAR